MNWDLYWTILSTVTPVLLAVGTLMVIGIVAVFIIAIPICLITDWFDRPKKEKK